VCSAQDGCRKAEKHEYAAYKKQAEKDFREGHETIVTGPFEGYRTCKRRKKCPKPCLPDDFSADVPQPLAPVRQPASLDPDGESNSDVPQPLAPVRQPASLDPDGEPNAKGAAPEKKRPTPLDVGDVDGVPAGPPAPRGKPPANEFTSEECFRNSDNMPIRDASFKLIDLRVPVDCSGCQSLDGTTCVASTDFDAQDGSIYKAPSQVQCLHCCLPKANEQGFKEAVQRDKEGKHLCVLEGATPSGTGGEAEAFKKERPQRKKDPIEEAPLPAQPQNCIEIPIIGGDGKCGRTDGCHHSSSTDTRAYKKWLKKNHPNKMMDFTRNTWVKKKKKYVGIVGGLPQKNLCLPDGWKAEMLDAPPSLPTS
jgi:hypothetical protein